MEIIPRHAAPFTTPDRSRYGAADVEFLVGRLRTSSHLVNAARIHGEQAGPDPIAMARQLPAYLDATVTTRAPGQAPASATEWVLREARQRHAAVVDSIRGVVADPAATPEGVRAALWGAGEHIDRITRDVRRSTGTTLDGRTSHRAVDAGVA